jgi:hypothetical protein
MTEHTTLIHCKRASGSDRAWFDTAEAAAEYRDKHPAYAGDLVVFCSRCSFFHCSNPNWLVDRPWETEVGALKPQ